MRRPPTVLALVAAVLATTLLGACGASSQSRTAATPTSHGSTPQSAVASTLPPITFAPISAQPAKRVNAELAIAFDAAAAARLLAQTPTGIDFTSRALVCLYLGERSGPWTVSLLGAALSPGALAIRARETRPRSGTSGSQVSYPATCATIGRSSLPTGSLAARAEDTTSGEFIVAATISVPPR